MSEFISLHEPYFGGNEWDYVKDCLDTGWVSSAGKFVDIFEQKIADFTGAKQAIAVVNGTAALQVSLRLAGVQPGDEVIVPSITFIAPVNAVRYNGAEPIFMDSDKYFNINVEKTVEFIRNETEYRNGYTYNKSTDKRIAALLAVHIFGNAAWLDELVLLCAERKIKVIEDAAESLGTKYISGKFSGRHAGTIGKLGCLSFNGNKIISTGGGGMILTDDVALAEKAKYLTTQAKDDGVRYIHNEIGYNFRLTNIQAALGVAQLEQLPGFLERKRDIYQQYVKAVEEINGLDIVSVPDYADNNHWLNVLRIDLNIYGRDLETLMADLQQEGIQTRPVWYPICRLKPYRDCQRYKVELAEELLKTSLCMPSSSQLAKKDFSRVIKGLHG